MTQILLYSAPKNYLETIDNSFYKPFEIVNATDYTYGDDWLSKPNVMDALYAYEASAKKSRDEYDILNSGDLSILDDQPQKKIPILVSEGLSGSLSLNTGENRDAFIEVRGVKYEAEVVGLISHMPGTSFTSYSVGSSLFQIEMSGYSSFSLG